MGIFTSYIGNQLSSNPSSAGDFLSNYFGSQLANNNSQANVQPQSTTINYNSDGSADITHKQTIGADSNLSNTQQTQTQAQAQPQVQAPQYINLANSSGSNVPYAPMTPVAPPSGTQPFQNATGSTATTPQAQGPVAPQAQGYTPPQAPQGVFGNMIQAESGGQQNGPNGQILTSPKGAVGIAQIMPQTAAQPGYGIAPATPQELATPQGNLQFGQRYFEGMYNHFGQDPEKAAAAYNAGPGTIETAMRKADSQGGTWKDYIPDETKKYLTQVFPEGEKTAKKIGPMIAGVPSSDVGMTPEEQAIHHIVLNSGDVNALGMGTYAGDHLIDPATKKAYADEHATQLEKNQEEQKAQKQAQDIIANGGVGLQRALKEEGDEGSYLKAYLFQRLGLHDLAKNEQQKLGAGDQWAQTMVDGKPAWVKYNGQGAPVKGYNAEGELSGKDLINTLNMKGVEQHTGKMQDVQTGKIYYEQTTPFGPRLVDNQGQVYSGDSKNLRAYGIGSDIATKNQIQLNALKNKLAYAGPEQAAKEIAKFEVDNGPLDPAVKASLMTPQGTVGGGQNLNVTQPGGAVAPQGGAVQTTQGNINPGAAQGNAQGAVAPQAASQQAPVAGPAVPGRPQAITQPSPTPGVPGAQGLRGPMQGETPAQYTAYKKAYEKEQADLSEGTAKTKLALPQYEAQADMILNTLNSVAGTTDANGVYHAPKGFETNVGVKGVTGFLQLPGTEARGWKAKYDQLMGQEFMDSYNQLRGAGAISDAEGKKAVSARAALSDPGISEEDFKSNAKILEDTVKRGVNRQRALAGLDPKYPDVEPGAKKETATQTKVVDGVTYEFDGKGWKAKK